MPYFSQKSKDRLATCDPRLQLIAREAIKVFDFKVLEGHRGRAEQERAVREGRSEVHYPNSNHNSSPSLAMDIAPWPIDWDDTDRFHLQARLILYIAERLGISVRWGGDWDSDGDLKDQTFNDLPHFELTDQKII